MDYLPFSLPNILGLKAPVSASYFRTNSTYTERVNDSYHIFDNSVYQDSTTVFNLQLYVDSMEFRNDNDIYSSQVIPMVFSSNDRVNLTVQSK